NNSSTDTDTVNKSADLQITKDDGVTSATAGSFTTYTITLKNNGLSTEPAGVAISDTIPAHTVASTPDPRCSVGPTTVVCTTSAALAPGASTTFSLTLTLDPDYPTTSLSNTATITS